MNFFRYLTSISLISLVVCCNNNAPSNIEDNSKPKDTVVSQTTTADTNESENDKEPPQVSFKVNDTVANTLKGGANDDDENLGMYTAASKNFSFDLMGDVKERPHRGWLHFTIDNFQFVPGKYSVSKINNARFTRYQSANAGGDEDFVADALPQNAGSSFSIEFTKVEKSTGALGNTEYLVSGTFSATLLNKTYETTRKDKQELRITEGSFTDIRVVGGPK